MNQRVNYNIYIGVRNGVDIGITEDNHVVARFSNVSNETDVINFGPATKSTFDNLISYLERLRIHAID